MNTGVFSRVHGIFVTTKKSQTSLLGGVRAILFSSYAGTHKSGTPQPSLDMDANRLVLLDRADNGDSGDSDNTSEVPF